MGYETQYNDASPYNRHQFKVDSFEQDLSIPLDMASIDSDISKWLSIQNFNMVFRQNQRLDAIFRLVYAYYWVKATDGLVLRRHVLASTVGKPGQSPCADDAAPSPDANAQPEPLQLHRTLVLAAATALDYQ